VLERLRPDAGHARARAGLRLHRLGLRSPRALLRSGGPGG
jgi:hypothetical protein